MMKKNGQSPKGFNVMIRSLAKGNKLILLLYIITAAVFAYFGARLGLVIGMSLDVAQSGETSAFIAYVHKVVQTVVYCIVSMLINYVFRMYYMYSAMSAVYNDTFSGFMRKTLYDYQTETVESWRSILVNDIRQIEKRYFLAGLDIISDSFSIAFSIFILAKENIYITLFVLACSMIPILLQKVAVSKIQTAVGKISQISENYVSHLSEMLRGLDAFIFEQTEHHVIRFHKKRASEFEMNYEKNYRIIEIWSGITNASTLVTTIMILIAGMFLTISNHITIGQMLAVSLVASNLSSPLSSLMSTIPSWLALKSLLIKVLDIGITKSKETLMLPSKSIAFDDVKLLMNDKRILDLNLTFNCGKKYVIVGESGSGKSSLLQVLTGFYTVNKGNVTFDGARLPEFGYSMPSGLVYLPQQAKLVPGNIETNLTLGHKKEVKDINDALELLNIKERIDLIDKAMVLDSSNAIFSRGELQRIALARMLLREPKIIVLDEATSALDLENYLSIESYLLKLNGITLISVSHRMDERVLPLYDDIIAMRNGEIVEHGTFDELLSKKGYFHELYNSYQSSDMHDNVNATES
jgi:ABC-type bacteriocin/lantibiotic exporter with double-glycine peptidase domain